MTLSIDPNNTYKALLNVLECFILTENFCKVQNFEFPAKNEKDPKFNYIDYPIEGLKF